MDILIPDEWLRNFLKTEATPKKIMEYLSLAGPTVDKIEKVKGADVYHIEVTTNRVDAASVYGIAREAYAVLPRFGVKTALARANYNPNLGFTDKVDYLEAKVDKKLCPRFAAVLVRGVEAKESPTWLKERLNWVGIRAINNVVDISNYIMVELGQPVHMFDYDKIKGAKMILRESKRGEEITTLDDKKHTLGGGDIVIEDGEGRLIDLAGIMGGTLSEVDENTKNVLLFVQTYDPSRIRKTSMNLAVRTQAAALFEKGLDTENVSLAVGRGIGLLEKHAGGKADKNILDIYPNPYKGKEVSTTIDFINTRLGSELTKKEIDSYLSSLGFEVSWTDTKLTASIPSYRASDINIEEDLVEEVARVYGYHNIESKLPEGSIPDPLENSPFEFEMEVKKTLAGWGGTEIYTYSLVPETFVDKNALKLKNPLGKGTEYLRTSLRPSLVQAAKENSGEADHFMLFELANIYESQTNALPKEVGMLAAVFANYSYRKAKGILEALLEKLRVTYTLKQEELANFKPGRHLEINAGNSLLGSFGELESGYYYFELVVEKLRDVSKKVSTYTPIPKYPAQVEDLTLILPEKTRVGEVVDEISNSNKLIVDAVLHDTYEDAHTFRVWYQSNKKTLTNEDVEIIREKLLKDLQKKFGASLKV